MNEKMEEGRIQVRVKRIPVDVQVQQMSSALAAYVSLPAAPWEDADDIRSPMQRAREMRRAGAQITQIAEAMGVSPGAIQHAVARGQL